MTSTWNLNCLLFLTSDNIIVFDFHLKSVLFSIKLIWCRKTKSYATSTLILNRKTLMELNCYLYLHTVKKSQAWETFMGRKIQSSTLLERPDLCWWRIFPIDLFGWRNSSSPLCFECRLSRMAFVTVWQTKEIPTLHPIEFSLLYNVQCITSVSCRQHKSFH
jgi:hypothetical protein